MGAKVIFFLISKFQQGLTYSALGAPKAPKWVSMQYIGVFYSFEMFGGHFELLSA